jgi:hypothetical protein
MELHLCSLRITDDCGSEGNYIGTMYRRVATDLYKTGKKDTFCWPRSIILKNHNAPVCRFFAIFSSKKTVICLSRRFCFFHGLQNHSKDPCFQLSDLKRSQVDIKTMILTCFYWNYFLRPYPDFVYPYTT